MKLLTVLRAAAGGAGVGTIEWLLRDEFVTDAAAPLSTPRDAEPGPGSWTIVQNDGQFSIDDGLLDIPAQTTPAWTDLGFYNTQSLTRAAGLALFALLKPSTTSDMPRVGFGSAAVAYSTSDTLALGIFGFEPYDNGLFQRTRIFPVANAESVVAVILRAAGAYHLFDEALLAVAHLGNTSTLRAKLVNYASVNKLDYLRLAQLPEPFSDDTLQTYKDAAPTADDTAEAGQDALHYIQWTPASSEVFEIRFRWIDDDNCVVLRCTQGAGIQFVKRHSGTETVLVSGTVGFATSTQYRIALRYAGNLLCAWVVNSAVVTFNCAYNSEVTGAKITGAATLANWEIYPAVLPANVMNEVARHTNPFLAGSGRTKQTIHVEDGGDITAAIATMRAGDALSLAPGGSYTLGAGVDGFASLPSGFWGHKTRVLGNGATITGGDISLLLQNKKHFHIENLNLVDATERCVLLAGCRWFTMNNVYADSNVGTALFDIFRFTAGCRDGRVTNCEAGASTGWGEHDGFECTDQCGDILFENCVAHGVVHGFEVWSDALSGSHVWKNYRITWRNCHAYDCEVGYSAEGGPQSLEHVEIVADGCTAENNSEYDYQGIDGAILYIENDTGGTTNGNVVIRS